MAAARCFVRDTLVSWGLPGRDDVVTDAVLLASELVTNAIVHAGTAVELTCRFDGATVEVSVLDWCHIPSQCCRHRLPLATASIVADS